MTQDFKSESAYYQNQPSMGGLVSQIAWSARQKMFATFMTKVQPHHRTTVLDVGVTSDRRQDSNFFEKLFLFFLKCYCFHFFDILDQLSNDWFHIFT